MRYVQLLLLGVLLAVSLTACLVRTYGPAPGPTYHSAPPPPRSCYNECANWGWRAPCYGCRPVRSCLAYRRVCR